MTLPHQPAADTYIRDLGTRMPGDDVKRIVAAAEEVARASGASILTRVHVRAAVHQFWRTEARPFGAVARPGDYVFGSFVGRPWFGRVETIADDTVVCLPSDGSPATITVPREHPAYEKQGDAESDAVMWILQGPISQ